MVLCFSAHALHIPTLFSDSKQIFRFPIKVLAWKPTDYPQLRNPAQPKGIVSIHWGELDNILGFFLNTNLNKKTLI